jgi:hypothetical protein
MQCAVARSVWISPIERFPNQSNLVASIQYFALPKDVSLHHAGAHD